MIKSFCCADTKALFETGKCKRFSGIANVAVRKLAQLDAAQTLEFLRSPPGNRLEALKGGVGGPRTDEGADQGALFQKGLDHEATDVARSARDEDQFLRAHFITEPKNCASRSSFSQIFLLSKKNESI